MYTSEYHCIHSISLLSNKVIIYLHYTSHVLFLTIILKWLQVYGRVADSTEFLSACHPLPHSFVSAKFPQNETAAVDMGEDYHRGKVPFSPHHARGYTASVGLIAGDANFDTREVLPIRFPHHWKVTVLPFPDAAAVEGSRWALPTLSGRETRLCLFQGWVLKHLWA